MGQCFGRKYFGLKTIKSVDKESETISICLKKEKFFNDL